MANRKTIEASFRPLETPMQKVATFSGVSPEIVAAISGAIACMYGSSATISGIKKSKRETVGGRSAWSMAGLLERTSAF